MHAATGFTCSAKEQFLVMYGCPVKPTVVHPASWVWCVVFARQTSDVGGNARPGHLPVGGMR